MGRREFREDLYHRLSDVVLEVPPLRARQDDIPLLIEHFRVLFNRKDDLAVTGLVDQAMATMTGYGWAGKVRSLAKVLREAMLLREEGWVELDDLRIATSAGRGPFAAGEPQAQSVPVTRAPLPVHARREAALRIAGQQGGVTRRQLAAYCGISGETARGVLSMLARLGLLRLVGKGSAARYVPT